MADQSTPVYTMLSAPRLPNSALCPIVQATTPEQVLVQIAPTDLAQCPYFAPYGYIPLQAVASGMTTPDATIEVVDPSGFTTRRDYCVLWIHLQYDTTPWHWERLSFDSLPEALGAFRLWQVDLLDVCPTCLLLHGRYLTCPLVEPESLEQALIFTGLALRQYGGTVYLVSWHPCPSLPGATGVGKIFRYAASRVSGLHENNAPLWVFDEWESGIRLLNERNIPTQYGWITLVAPSHDGQPLFASPEIPA